MAVRYYCDPCGKEIDHSANRSTWSVDKEEGSGWPKANVQIEVRVTIYGTTNDGHICSECVAKVIREGRYARGILR